MEKSLKAIVADDVQSALLDSIAQSLAKQLPDEQSEGVRWSAFRSALRQSLGGDRWYIVRGDDLKVIESEIRSRKSETPNDRDDLGDSNDWEECPSSSIEVLNSSLRVSIPLDPFMRTALVKMLTES